MLNATVPPVPLIVPESEWNAESLPSTCSCGRPGGTIVFPARSVKPAVNVTGDVPTEPKTVPTGPSLAAPAAVEREGSRVRVERDGERVRHALRDRERCDLLGKNVAGAPVRIPRRDGRRVDADRHLKGGGALVVVGVAGIRSALARDAAVSGQAAEIHGLRGLERGRNVRVDVGIAGRRALRVGDLDRHRFRRRRQILRCACPERRARR